MSIACHDLSMALLVLVSIVMLVVVALAFGVFALLSGDDPGLSPADADHALPLPGSRPLAEKDVSTLRFDSTMRGYRMDQVDRAMRRTAYDIGYKDEMIAVLEAEVTALREGRTEDAELMRKAREGAAAPVGNGRLEDADELAAAQESELAEELDDEARNGPDEAQPADEDELVAAVESEHAAVIETDAGRDADRPASAGT
jgi:DivIVA domain-containing protein